MPWYRPRWLQRRSVPIPVVRLTGMIGAVPLRAGLTLQSVEPMLAAAFSIKRAPAVALVINSPGGSPVQSSLIARRIRDLAGEEKKHVIAFVEDVAASGGYWLALAADEIVVDRASLIGSIGVITAGFGLDEAIAKLGIERRVHATGPRKALLDTFRPERPEDVEVLKEIQGEILEAFKSTVRERRGDKLEISDDELFSGRVWGGGQAQRHGLVDGLGELRATLRERYGENVKLRTMNRGRSLLRRRLGFDHQGAPLRLASDLVPMLFGRLEEEALWRRYGL